MDISEEQQLEVVVKKNVEDLNEIVCTTTYLIECYYNLYLNKVPCMNSKQTGYIWLMEVLQGNDKRCQRMFRMEKDVLLSLCSELENYYGFMGSRRIHALEILALTLNILGHGMGNRLAQERFQHSGETISRYFGITLDIICLMAKDIIKPSDPEFKDIPEKILRDSRYMPHFKVRLYKNI